MIGGMQMINLTLLSVTADTDFYSKWSDTLSNESLWNDGWRSIGWAIVKFLSWLCSACEDLLIVANKAIGFIYSDPIVDFVSKWKYIIIGVLIIAVLLFGITMIVNQKQDRTKLLQNVVIAVCVLTCLSAFIPTLSSNTSFWSKALLDVETSSSAESVVKGAVTDLYYLDANDFSDEAAEIKNNISADRILNIDYNETISSSDDVSNPDIFSYKMKDDKNGEPCLEEIDDSGFSLNNNTYYRYHIDYTAIYFTLFATAIVMIFTAFKVVKIVFDIIVHHILAVLMAASDWASGQKLKEVIKSLFALFFSIFMCSVMIKLYFMFSAWTSNNIESSAARAFVLIFAAFAVIDGPNIVEKLFGVDAGLSNTFRSVSTLYFAGRGVADIARGASHTMNSAVRNTAHNVGGIGGFFSGISSARKNAENASADKKNNISDSAAKKGGNSNSSEKGAGANLNSDSNQNTNPDYANNNNTAHADDNLNLNGESSTPNNSDKKSIANAAANGKGSNFDYFGNKARNPRSVIGAGARGYQNGRYIGEKIGNATAKRSARKQEKQNLKGDKS